jgi:uncharacterized ion transporter superfamily protein YfcC
MLAAEITIFCLLGFMFLLLGGVIGWIIKTHTFETQLRHIVTHPEMFDENGNIIPDEILAVRFENDYDIDEDEETD